MPFFNRCLPQIRKLILPGTIVITVLFLVACSSSSPRIVVDPPSQKLAEMPQEALELTYTIRNTGDSLLKVEITKTSCYCIEAALERDTLPPGESTQLRVTVLPIKINLPEDVVRVIFLRSNDPATPTIDVELHIPAS